MRIINSIFLGVFALSISTLSAKQYFYGTCHEKLLQSPDEVLQEIESVRNQFQSEATHGEFFATFDELYNTVNRYEQSCPLLLLDECTWEGFAPCNLSRLYEKHYRESFEEHAVQILCEKLQSNDEVTYASFGSGGQFQDLIILSKVLEQHPYSCINIDCIDMQYKAVAEFRDCIGENRHIYASTQEIARMIAHNENAIHEISACKATSDEQKAHYRYILPQVIFVHEQRAIELIAYLQKQYPNAQLNLRLYSDEHDYRRDLTYHQRRYPDLITAADIMDDMGQMSGALDGFVRLSLISQMHNPLSQNCILAIDTRLPSCPARIGEVARTNSLPNATRYDFPDEEAETHEVWVRLINIEGWLESLILPPLEVLCGLLLRA